MTDPAPKVVMLVDNTVDGDSRVQKSARFMAELGWDVTLIGRSPTKKELVERLGDATLLRVPVAMTLHTRDRLAPGFTWRRPLAYPDHETAAAAELRDSWRRLELQSRLAVGSGPGLLVPRVVGKAQRVVHRLRHRQFRAAAKDAVAPRSRAGARWRRSAQQWSYDDPFLADLEVAFAPVLARLAPDLVHAHDFRTVGIAVRHKERMRAKKGATVPVVVYDAHEFLPGVGILDARRRRGDEAYEREHIGRADAVITVSPFTSEKLVSTHGLTREPLLVLNTPQSSTTSWSDDAPDVRSAAHVPADAPLVVYVGVSAAKRGLDVAADALEQLPDVHLVLVTKRNDYVNGLQRKAKERGYGDRFHVLPYVLPDEVSSFVRTADVGISPLEDTLNHQVTLPTKLFEYAQGRLPVITSDVRASTAIVEEEGIGLSFPIGDVDAYAEAVRTALAKAEELRAPYEKTDLLSRWTWEHQCAPVDGLYRELIGRGPSEASRKLRDVEQALADGELPETDDVLAATRLLLQRADRALEAGDLKGAAAEGARASLLLFHRTLHFDHASSPLALDPTAYLAPWHDAHLGGRVSARASTVRPEWSGRPDKVAVLSYKNMMFLPPLERALDELGVERTRTDLLDLAPGALPQSPLQQIATRLRPPGPTVWGDAIDAALGDADTVWVEWGQRAAVLTSQLPDRRRRCIVRIHSFEAFTVFPHLTDWSGVDDLVFVGPHLRDLLVPQLRGFDPSTTRTHVLPIGLDTAEWRRPKNDGAARTLALVGWAAPAKDAVWALDLLGRLRQHDPSYRLLLVGHEPKHDGPAGVRRYHEQVLERLERPDVAGAVERVAFTSDVAALLQDVGVIVSSSVRESLHMAVVEGAASGAVPLVRNWPMLKQYDGPRRLFPTEWVVDELDEAERRVLAVTATDRFEKESASAADAAAERFDHAVARAGIAALLDLPCPT
jgi:glycosyltransferase involved in cell wall biosynthesis